MTAANRERLKVAGARSEHGTHARYNSGCHCFKCRVGHTRYNTERDAAVRRGERNAVVDAAPVREHLLRLSKMGIGRRAVAEAASVSQSVIGLVMRGERKGIREQAAKRILAVDETAASGGTLIDARPTWRILDGLIERGYTKAQLALWLGAKYPALQIRRDRVTAETAAKVKRMAALLDAGKLRRA